MMNRSDLPVGDAGGSWAPPSAPPGPRSWFAVAVLAFILLLAGFWGYRQTDKALRRELLEQARLLAGTLDVRSLGTLTGTERDRTALPYRETKQHLIKLKKSLPLCRFLYVMARRPDGSFYFVVDGEPEDSSAESPPGQVYPEASNEMKSAFERGEDLVEGPVADRWGTWVSAMVLLRVQTDRQEREWLRSVPGRAAALVKALELNPLGELPVPDAGVDQGGWVPLLLNPEGRLCQQQFPGTQMPVPPGATLFGAGTWKKLVHALGANAGGRWLFPPFEGAVAAVGQPAYLRRVGNRILVILARPENRGTVSYLGMDVSSRTWRWQIWGRMALPVGLCLFFLILLVASLHVKIPFVPRARPVLRRLMPVLVLVSVLFLTAWGTLFWHQEKLRSEERGRITDTRNKERLLTFLSEEQKRIRNLAALLVRHPDVLALLDEPPEGVRLNGLDELGSACARLGGDALCVLDHQGNIHLCHDPQHLYDKGPRFPMLTGEAPVTREGNVLGRVRILRSLVGVLSDFQQNDVLRILMNTSGPHAPGVSSTGSEEVSWLLKSLPGSGETLLAALEHWDAEQVRDVHREGGRTLNIQALPLRDLLPGNDWGQGTVFLVEPESLEQTSFGSFLVLGSTLGGVMLCLVLALIWVLLHRTDQGIRAQQKDILAQKRKYQELFEQSSEGILLLSEHHLVLEANPRAMAILGLQRALVLGRPWEDLFGCDGSLNGQEEMAQRWRDLPLDARMGIPRNFSLVLPLGEGEEREVEGAISIFHDQEGQELIHLLLRDVTERVRAERERSGLKNQLLQAQKMELVGRLAGGVAHDFNNMIGVILGYTELMLRRMQPQDPFWGRVTEIRKAAERSSELTSQLLAFSRRQTIRPRVLDLNEVVYGMLSLLRRLIGEDIELVWQPTSNKLPLHMDPSQVDQVLANLCVNARDALTGAGVITLATSRGGEDDRTPRGMARLSVEDHGSGINRDTLEHLFEPFFTTKPPGKGTGLGLSVVYGIVQQNGGTIKVFSEEGKGTRFDLFLPLHEGAEEELTLEEKSLVMPTGGRETLLLVEDESSMLEMTVAMLEGLGYRVLRAHNPQKALDIARKNVHIDLLMTDVIMPGMSGMDLAEQLVLMHPGLKVLFASGYTANILAPHGMLEKEVPFLAKPFTLRELAQAVRKALEGGYRA